MKRNTRLYHIPAVLYLRGSGEINLSELYNRGFADVAAADTPEEETADRIVALARHHRLYAVRAHLLEMAGDHEAAVVNYREAAGRTASIPEQRYLLTRAARMQHLDEEARRSCASVAHEIVSGRVEPG